MILAGDIGGTKVNLGVFETAGNTLRLAETATFLTRDYSVISEILSEFITSTGRPQEVLSLGVAGPVTGSSCRLTNIDWEIDAGSLKQEVVVEMMRDDIELEPVNADVVDPRSGRAGQATIAFTLGYENESPDRAQAVAHDDHRGWFGAVGQIQPATTGHPAGAEPDIASLGLNWHVKCAFL